MQITKQDMLILLQGGGILEKVIEGYITSERKPQKLLEKSNYPRYIALLLPKVIVSRVYPLELSSGTEIAFYQKVFFPVHIFKEENVSFKIPWGEITISYTKFSFLLNNKQELYIKFPADNDYEYKFYAAVFTLPQYILEAPSIKEVDIVNTFNIPLEGQ